MLLTNLVNHITYKNRSTKLYDFIELYNYIENAPLKKEIFVLLAKKCKVTHAAVFIIINGLLHLLIFVVLIFCSNSIYDFMASIGEGKLISGISSSGND